MNLETVVTEEKHHVLIIGEMHAPVVKSLVEYFTSRGHGPIVCSHIPKKLPDHVEYCFCFTTFTHIVEDAVRLSAFARVVLICTGLEKYSRDHILLLTKTHPHCKVAVIEPGSHKIAKLVEQILYLAFNNDTPTVFLASALPRAHAPPPVRHPLRVALKEKYLHFVSRPMRGILIVTLILLLAHFILLLPLVTALASFVAELAIANQNRSSLLNYDHDPFPISRRILVLARASYAPTRPFWLLIGLGSHIDNAFALMEAVPETRVIAVRLTQNSAIFASYVFDPQVVEQRKILQKKDQISADVDFLASQLQMVRAITSPSILSRLDPHNRLQELSESLTIARELLQVSDAILARDTSKLYVVFFVNNAEIRPGGGFIGSFALVRVTNMQIKELRVYDAYDADGQLKARIPPPEPISKYLNQPNFFLRDSAFTPDFPTNLQTAELFLQKTLGIEGIDGGLLVSFEAIRELVLAIGPIRLSEYDKTITANNLYLTLQLEAEENFFPGSANKKNIIDALVKELIVRMSEPGTAVRAARSIRESFRQKLMAAAAQDTLIQSAFDRLYWSGRLLPPTCIGMPSSRCIADYVFPVEANLGVNKANAFVSRFFRHEITIDPGGVVSGSLTITLANNSYDDLYPGGPYKNYLQILLSNDVEIDSVTVDNAVHSSTEISQDQHTRATLFIEVPPQRKRVIAVRYRHRTALGNERPQLQIITQKQLGLPAADLLLKIDTGRRSYQAVNFTPIVAGGALEYTTVVDSDKFYYITFNNP
jgi:hypothetical protein